MSGATDRNRSPTSLSKLSSSWLQVLEKLTRRYAQNPTTLPEYRGDSYQGLSRMIFKDFFFLLLGEALQALPIE